MSRRLSPFISLLLAGLILVSSVATPQRSAAAQQPGVPSSTDFVPDELLVRFKPQTSSQHADEIVRGHGMAQVRSVQALDVRVLRLPPGLTVERAIEIFQNLPEVDLAEPNYILYALLDEPTEITDQWGLTQIKADQAWGLIPHKPVLIAVVDTGIDRTHPDLDPNIWGNPKEITGTVGIDDDGNGYVDDTWGYDFYNRDNDPTGDHFHGTAVASVAAGVQDRHGMAGVCPWCKLMAVKVLGADGSGTLDVVANGITYAANEGARVINLSLGAASGAQVLADAVAYAWTKGAVVVAAAGNDGNNTTFYPAGYANAIAVASTGQGDLHSCFSNYGAFVDVSAPGERIYTAILNGGYGLYSGTSLSTPHVSGLAGLLISQDLNRSNATVRSLIESTAVDLGPTGRDDFFGTGRVDAVRAVNNQTSPTTPPAGPFSNDAAVTGFPHQRKLARDISGVLHTVWHTYDNGEYKVLYASSTDSGVSWSSPQVVFSSSAETYHPGLAVDNNNVYIAFPSKQGGSKYSTYFTKKTLIGATWSEPTALMGGTLDAIRPDIFVDPSNGRLHLVASSYDNQPNVYYTASSDKGVSWTAVQSISLGTGRNSQYADVHANGEHVYIAARALEMFWGIIPYFHLETIRSLNGGNTWTDLTTLVSFQALLTGAYGLSLAGVGDRLYLAYEHNGGIYFRQSESGVNWSAAVNLGSGVWPTISQEADGRAWVLWENSKEVFQRAFTGSIWETAVSLGKGVSYPNAKLGASAGLVEWMGTACNGAPFRVAYGSFLAGGGPPQTGHLIVQKTTSPSGDPTMFTINATGSGTITGGGAGTVTDAADKNYEVTPGTYSVAENVPAGWEKTGDTCQNVVVAAGETKTCLLTNVKRGHLVVQKTTDPAGDASVFTITITANGTGTITGGGSGTVTDASDKDYEVTPGTYSVAETVPAGWDKTGDTCQNVIVGAGEIKTCTFTNTKRTHLKLVKELVNDNGGTAVTTAWTLSASGPTPISGPGGAEGDVNAGTYTLSERGPGGYTASAWVCTGTGTQSGDQIALDLGESATCTITNNDITAHLTLVKAVVNDNGGTAAATDWTLSASGPTPISGSGGIESDVNAGTYALSESGPAGYTASAWACTGTGTQTGNQIALDLGESATCTITNDDNAPALHLRKLVVNDNGGTAVATDWTLEADGPTPIRGSGGIASNVNAGTYTLSESGSPTGYTASAWVCVGGTQSGSSITLGLGQSATCTITNDDIAPKLHLRKLLVNNDGGTAVDTGWTLNAAGPTPLSGSTPVDSGPTFSTGTYTLSESSGPAGYTASEWSCVKNGGTSVSGNLINLGLGDEATCTITNTDNTPQLKLVKSVINNNGGTKGPNDWSLYAATTAVGYTDRNFNNPGGSGSFHNVYAGVAYDLSESVVTGYSSSGEWSCTGGVLDLDKNTVTLALGEQVTCTITNTQNAPSSLSTGFMSPTANSQVTTTGDKNGYEVNPVNAYTDDGKFAVDNNSGTGTSTSYTNTKKDRHDFYSYDFPILINATILGIEVRVHAQVDSTSNSPKIYIQLSWDGGRTWSDAKPTPVLGISEGNYTLGGATDTWGRAWIPDNFTYANFRVRVIDVASSTSRDFSLDWIAVNVTYRKP